MAKTLKGIILEALKKESLSALELAKRVNLRSCHFMLSRLEEEGLIEYDLATDKWRLNRR